MNLRDLPEAPKAPGSRGSLIPRWLIVIAVAIIIGCLVALTGCATQDLRAHEEKHCEGWTHQVAAADQVVIRYEWTKTRTESIKPWIYFYVDDPHTVCSRLGAQAAKGLRINACANWKPQGCTIILPKE